MTYNIQMTTKRHPYVNCDIVDEITINGIRPDIDNIKLLHYLSSLMSDKVNSIWLENEPINYKSEKSVKKIEARHVYIMIDEANSFYKIGRARNPKTRERTLQSEKPTIEMLFNFHCTDAKSTEKVLHDKFKEKRVRGEWFKLDENDVNWIKSNYL